MKDGKVGFAIVGAGLIAPVHAAAIREIPGAELVAVVDPAPGVAARRGEALGVPHHAELDAALDRPDVDVVCVCAPTGLHAEIGVRAARAGKHVAVEKPIDVSLDAADRLIAACRDAGVKLTVLSQNRFAPAFLELRELVDGGRLGRLLIGDASIKWYRSPEYYRSAGWRGTRSLDGGGCLMNQGIHYVDVLQWLMGPVRSVVARTSTLLHEIEVEDVAMAVLRFESGAMGMLEAATVAYPGLTERLEVTGTNGTVVVERGETALRRLRDEADTGPRPPAEDDWGWARAAAQPASISPRGHAAQLGDMVAAIREDREPRVTGEDGRRPLEIVLAVYESSRTGGEVSLPLNAGGDRRA